MIYVQGLSGLTQLSPKLSKEKIIEALGFTPADKNSFYEDESGALLVADEQGYVIARIDANGLTTTKVTANAIELNGEDLATKLQELATNIPEAEVDLSNYYTKEEVDQAIEEIVPPETDLSNYALSADVEAHANNDDIHVTYGDKAIWNAKSDFNGDFNELSNAPHIVNDNEDELIVCDSAGNVILRATAEGLHAAAIYVNGKAVNEPVWKFTVKDKEYEVTPSTQKWSDWINANPGKGLVMSGETIYYDYVTDQWLIDVKSSDFIIPGYKYTYNTNY